MGTSCGAWQPCPHRSPPRLPYGATQSTRGFPGGAPRGAAVAHKAPLPTQGSIHEAQWDSPNYAPQPFCLQNGGVGGRMPPTLLRHWDPVQAAGHSAQPSPATSTMSHGPALAPAGFLHRDSAPALPDGNGSHGVPQNPPAIPQNPPWDPSPAWQEGGSCIVGGQGGGGSWRCPEEWGAGWERGSRL